METSNAYQSIYDGPAIDAAISRATEGGHIDAAIQAKPNRNLLDNWYFLSPVNQRGQTSYIGAGYGIDRWKSGNSNLTVNLTSDGIVLSSGSAASYLSQYFDAGISSEGSYTISALVEAITGTAYLQVIYADGTYGTAMKLTTGLNALTEKTTETISRVLFQINAGASVTVKAAKLELGSQQTLAHQDADGKWVLNEISDYGEQLERCQRYYQVFDYTNAYTVIAFGQAAETTVFRGLIPTLVAMRTTPTIVFTGERNSLVLIGKSSTFGASSATPTVINANINGIGINMSGISVTKNEVYVLQAYGCKLELSADL